MKWLQDAQCSSLVTLKHEYERLSYFKKIFFPRELARLLKTIVEGCPMDTPTALLICRAYFKSTWSLQKFGFACLNQFSKEYWIKACEILYTCDLLSGSSAQNNFDAITTHHNSRVVANLLISLKKLGLLNKSFAQDNFNLAARHELVGLSAALNILHTSSISNHPFTQNCFEYIANNPRPEVMANVVCRLDHAGLLTHKDAKIILKMVSQHTNPQETVDLLIELDKIGALSEEQLKKIDETLTNNSNLKHFTEDLFQAFSEINKLNRT